MTKELEFYCKDFVERGIKLYPISRDKKPCISEWQKKATTDFTQIEAWAKQFPGCNFGAVAGVASGIVILDVDVKGGQPGLLSLEEMEAEYGVLHTLQVRTPSGGYHFYFKHPGGDRVRNRNKLQDYPGVEFKAKASGAVIPGSLYADGGAYTIEVDTDIAEMPKELLELVTTKTKVKAVIETARDARISEGSRNNTLFDKACSYLRDGYPEPEAEAMLKAYNQTWCTEPLPEEELKQQFSVNIV